MELKKYKLKDIATVWNGATPSSNHPEFFLGEISWLTPKDLSDQKNKYIFRGERNITQNAYDSCSTHMLPEGTILMSSRAPIGLLAIAGKQVCTNQGFKNIVVNHNICYNEYLYYYLTYHLPRIIALGSGTTFTEVSKQAIEQFDVELPDIHTQHCTANLLKAIDDKIALNREINRNLEAMARQLYDYWFVQFDFPDANGNPYKSSGGKMVWNEKLKREIPEGWEVDNILSICDIKVGGTPSKYVTSYWEKGTIPFFAPTDVSDNVYQLDTIDHITHDGLDNCASSLFQIGDVILTARGSIGKMVIVGKPMAMNQSCYALTPKFKNTVYLYFLSKELIEWLKAKGSGSVFKSFNVQDVEYSQLCIAPSSMILQYCATVEEIFAKIREKILEVDFLIKQRDELLPLLMNGQVSVMPSEVNCDLSHD